MLRFSCPFLNGEVELTEERERHIAWNHPELLPAHKDRIAETLADPDNVRRSSRLNSAQLFSRWFEGVRGGKHIVVVVATDASPIRRSWVVTAYLARRLAEGEIEWKRS